jgi:hypothetical protein
MAKDLAADVRPQQPLWMTSFTSERHPLRSRVTYWQFRMGKVIVSSMVAVLLIIHPPGGVRIRGIHNVIQPCEYVANREQSPRHMSRTPNIHRSGCMVLQVVTDHGRRCKQPSAARAASLGSDCHDTRERYVRLSYSNVPFHLASQAIHALSAVPAHRPNRKPMLQSGIDMFLSASVLGL